MPADFKKPASSISQRLQQAQTHETKEPPEKPSSISTASKTQLLNTTLRFIKSTEHTLHYSEMPLTQAQYIYSLLSNPKSNLSVGFGYKSIYAPLFEAMDLCGLDYEFRISFVETNNSETAALKLEKIPRKKDSSKGDSSLNSSSSSTKLSKKDRKKRNKSQLTDGVTAQFLSDTLQKLLQFTGDAGRASVTFDMLTDEEMAFIRGVKTLAGSPASYSTFDPQLRVSLKQLNCNIAEVMKTCKIRIEEGQAKKSRARFITLKKVPREIGPVTPLRPITRSRSAASAKSRDRSLSTNRRTRKGSVGKGRSMSKDRDTKETVRKNRSASKDGLIQFKSGGKLFLSEQQLEGADKRETVAAEKQPSGLNKRKTKLLEDMAVPLESDKGMRMMKMMGWSGGALGTRGHGILEPLVPAIELPAGAGLGHIPPPKPETRPPAAFRADLLHNLRDLVTCQATEKLLEYRLPLSKKDKKFLNTALSALNKRSVLGLTLKIEVDLVRQLLLEMLSDPELELRAEISQDLKKITLIKSTNPNLKHLKRPKPKKIDKTASITMTVLNTEAEYELINDDSINTIITDVIPSINTTCKTPVAVKARATRILFLGRFIDFVKGERVNREFRFEGTLQKKMASFLEAVVTSVNNRVRSGYITPEELEWFEELMRCAEGFVLTIEFLSKSKFILTKKERPTYMQYQKRFVNSAWPHPNNNNDTQTDNQNHTKDTNNTSEKKNETPIVLPVCSRKQKLIDAAKEQVKEEKVTEEIVNSTEKEKNQPLKQEIIDLANQEKVESPKQEIEDISKVEFKEVVDSTEKEKNEPLKQKKETVESPKQEIEDISKVEFKEVVDSTEKEKNEPLKQRKEKVESPKQEIEDISKVEFKEVVDFTEKEKNEPLKQRKEKVESPKQEIEYISIVEKVEILDLYEDKENNEPTVIKSTEDEKVKVDNCDIEYKNNIENVFKKEKTETDNLCLCDTKIDTSKDLELTINETDLSLKVEEYDNANASPGSKRSLTNSTQETDAKKTKITQIKNLLIISLNDPEKKINTEIVKKIQTRISQEIDECVDFLPLLKCHGLQEEGLIYSCHDDNDVDWLKNIIISSDLDLKVSNGDVCVERKSRKLVIKINSFIPLDCKKVFSRIELYNNGLDTSGWGVLSEQTYSSYVLYIVEVDEKSFKYISREGFSLHVGLDKAQFSIIF